MPGWPRWSGTRTGQSDSRLKEIRQFFRQRFLAFILLAISPWEEFAISTLLALEAPEAAPGHRQWFPAPGASDYLPSPGRSERRAETIADAKTDARREPARARIMVVDDMPDVQEFLRDFLEEEGYAVEAFGNATDALQRLDEFRPGVILLDILLPGLSGLAALEQIRGTNPEVGIIMVTGIGDDAIARKTLAQGAFDYIPKPIDLDYLKRSLETFLLV